jgi:hypothetical protein
MSSLELSEQDSLEHFNLRINSSQFNKGLCLMVTDAGKICAAGTCRPIYEPAQGRSQKAAPIPVDLAEGL